MIQKFLLFLIRAYQKTLSPDHSWLAFRYPYGYCRYHPTCSQYGYEAVARHGAARGSWLSLKRVLRCHPWAQGGIDPVPLTKHHGRTL